MFEDAGKNLFLGQLDPRVLIGFFPELRGSLFGPDDEADVFAGASVYMPPESSVDDISEYCLLRAFRPPSPSSSLSGYSFPPQPNPPHTSPAALVGTDPQLPST
jgi:hypothetical protein